jgi:hypothetical protein
MRPTWSRSPPLNTGLGCQTPWRNQPAKLATRAICARAVVGNSDGPRFAAWQEDRCGPPAAARPLLAWLAQQLRHNAGRFDRHRRPPRANDRREGALPVRYVRPCPLMPSVTMGIDAAVTANTNSSNTATREINATPNFFRVQVFGALKIPTLKRRGRSSSALGSMQFCPGIVLTSNRQQIFVARSRVLRCPGAWPAAG